MKKIAVREYRRYNKKEILPLYEAVGWSNYTERPDMLETAFERSLKVLAAYDDGKLVGIVRAVGDGASVVFVQDLLVLPAYQRRGIGTLLLKTLLSQYERCYQKVLFADNTTASTEFYQAAGLYPAHEFGCTVFFRTY